MDAMQLDTETCSPPLTPYMLTKSKQISINCQDTLTLVNDQEDDVEEEQEANSDINVSDANDENYTSDDDAAFNSDYHEKAEGPAYSRDHETYIPEVKPFLGQRSNEHSAVDLENRQRRRQAAIDLAWMDVVQVFAETKYRIENSKVEVVKKPDQGGNPPGDKDLDVEQLIAKLRILDQTNRTTLLEVEDEVRILCATTDISKHRLWEGKCKALLQVATPYIKDMKEFKKITDTEIQMQLKKYPPRSRGGVDLRVKMSVEEKMARQVLEGLEPMKRISAENEAKELGAMIAARLELESRQNRVSDVVKEGRIQLISGRPIAKISPVLKTRIVALAWKTVADPLIQDHAAFRKRVDDELKATFAATKYPHRTSAHKRAIIEGRLAKEMIEKLEAGPRLSAVDEVETMISLACGEERKTRKSKKRFQEYELARMRRAKDFARIHIAEVYAEDKTEYLEGFEDALSKAGGVPSGSISRRYASDFIDALDGPIKSQALAEVEAAAQLRIKRLDILKAKRATKPTNKRESAPKRPEKKIEGRSKIAPMKSLPEIDEPYMSDESIESNGPEDDNGTAESQNRLVSGSEPDNQTSESSLPEEDPSEASDNDTARPAKRARMGN